MRRLFLRAALFVSLLVGPSLAVAGNVSAVDVFAPCSSGAGASAVCQDAKGQGSSGSNPIVGFIMVIIQVIALIIGLASVIVIIVSGIRLITSGGDSNGMAGARQAIIFAVLGLIVAILAEAIVAFVLNKLD